MSQQQQQLHESSASAASVAEGQSQDMQTDISHLHLAVAATSKGTSPSARSAKSNTSPKPLDSIDFASTMNPIAATAATPAAAPAPLVQKPTMSHQAQSAASRKKKRGANSDRNSSQTRKQQSSLLHVQQQQQQQSDFDPKSEFNALSPSSASASNQHPSQLAAGNATSGGNNANAVASAAAASRKKKGEKGTGEVTFDESDLSQPLPTGLKLYCRNPYTGKYHHCKILDRRDCVAPANLGVKQVLVKPMVNGTARREDILPSELAQLDFTHHPMIYYVHYSEWDRRMDEWTSRDRLLLMSQINKLAEQARSNVKTEARPQLTASGGGGAAADAAMKRASGGKENVPPSSGDLMDTDTPLLHSSNVGTGVGPSHDINAIAHQNQHATAASTTSDLIASGGEVEADHGHHGGNFSSEDIKAHEEATKVKNIDAIQFGAYRMTTWYYSPMPIEYAHYDVLYFCEFCLSFFGHESELFRHSAHCMLRHPPGNEIYRSEERNVTIAMFELDGARERVYCENLCYIAKLFLDHKTLEFDCTPFLFYVLCEVDQWGYHVVGYFSKEKISLSGFNLACILTLPCHQRKGYGKVLISISYELSKMEQKVGSPEKPISDLGKVSYMSYWSTVLTHLLHLRQQEHQQQNQSLIQQNAINNRSKTATGKLQLQLTATNSNSTPQQGSPQPQSKPGSASGVDEDESSLLQISIQQLSEQTCITTEDIVDCLKTLHVLVWYKGKWVYSETNLNHLLREREDKKRKAHMAMDENTVFVSHVDPLKLHWTPFSLHKRAKV